MARNGGRLEHHLVPELGQAARLLSLQKPAVK